jgi:methionine-rich copper-binding protein CopC
VLGLVGIETASAHSELIDSIPVAGAEMTDAPTAVRLTFSDLLGKGSTVDVVGADFQSRTSGPTIIDAERSDSMSVSLRHLEPGDYSVQYHAVEAADGHSVDGAYSFRVLGAEGPPDSTLTATVETAAPASSAKVPPTAEAALGTSSDRESKTGPMLAGALLAALLLLALVARSARARAAHQDHGEGA